MTSKFDKNKKLAHEAIAECVTYVLPRFWLPLWSITEQTHDRMESIFLYNNTKNVNGVMYTSIDGSGHWYLSPPPVDHIYEPINMGEQFDLLYNTRFLFPWSNAFLSWTTCAGNRPFPSSLVPLFQSESKCETIVMKMTLICMRMKLHAELIFIWKVSHLDSFLNWGTRELGNGLFEQWKMSSLPHAWLVVFLFRKPTKRKFLMIQKVHWVPWHLPSWSFWEFRFGCH